MSKKPEIVVVAEKRVINSEINMYSEELDFSSLTVTTDIIEYSCAMKSHFRKFGNQMSGSGNHLCNYASLLA